jgi:hypothetical protein
VVSVSRFISLDLSKGFVQNEFNSVLGESINGSKNEQYMINFLYVKSLCFSSFLNVYYSDTY